MNTPTATAGTTISNEAMDCVQYEARTKAYVFPDGSYFTIKDLRRAFELVSHPHDWKRGFSVFVPHNSVTLVVKAIEWFHGAKAEIGGIQPLTGKVLVSSPGYSA